jgi:NAD(P)-dependent dehydrogenase (short-subunit alcohol dehydrogenase family)
VVAPAETGQRYPKLSLSGKVALVTGAGKGLGRAAALSLARAGADVAIASRTARDLDAVAAEISATGRQALTLVLDARQSKEVDAAVDQVVARLGSLDIMVQSVGRSLRKPSLALEDSEWRDLIATNLDATFFACRAAGRQMLKQGSGSIINIASAAGLRGRPTNAPYSAAKAGVINLSRALAVEWAPHGVRVNVLAPGRFLTPLTQGEMSDPARYGAFVKQVPLGRIGQPEELEEIIVWLAAEASSFVTGSVIVMDGGQTLL